MLIFLNLIEILVVIICDDHSNNCVCSRHAINFFVKKATTVIKEALKYL